MNPQDLNLWANWALYATAGMLPAADALMREHASAVELAAGFLRRRFPVERVPLYRGLLLEPWRMPAERVLLPRESDRHSSWTEDRDVARWFADPGAVLAELVVAEAPDVLGWLATRAAPEGQDVLFHWSWAERLGEFGPRLWELAHMHPDLAPCAAEVEWNMRSQREVILLPCGYAVDSYEPSDTDDLNRRLTLPSFAARRAAS